MMTCLSVHQRNYLELAALTIHENRAEYARRHGYLTHVYQALDAPDGTPLPLVHRDLGLCKLSMLIEVAAHYHHYKTLVVR